jgi:hypothetical protein
MKEQLLKLECNGRQLETLNNKYLLALLSTRDGQIMLGWHAPGRMQVCM